MPTVTLDSATPNADGTQVYYVVTVTDDAGRTLTRGGTTSSQSDLKEMAAHYGSELLDELTAQSAAAPPPPPPVIDVSKLQPNADDLIAARKAREAAVEEAQAALAVQTEEENTL